MADERTAERRHRRPVRNASVRLAVLYAVAATLWIVTSDQLVGALHVSHEVSTLINSAKGFLFVIVTALLLYAFSRRYIGRLEESEERYYRLFENATEGVTIFRVVWGEGGGLRDLVIEDVNPAQTARTGLPRERLLGTRMSATGDLDEEMCAYFGVVREAVLTGNAMRTEVHAEGRDAYTIAAVFPFARDLWALAETDITEVRHAQEVIREQDERIRQAYEDVLDAVTGGKLALVTEDRIGQYLGDPLTPQEPIDAPEQLGEARRVVRDAVERRFPGADIASVLNSAGEALNNVLTHARDGTYQVFAKDGTVQVAVSDRGPGIDFRSLPRATLVPGFSTTATLGMGFTIMLKLADRVLLSTRGGRTVLVLETSLEH